MKQRHFAALGLITLLVPASAVVRASDVANTAVAGYVELMRLQQQGYACIRP